MLREITHSIVEESSGGMAPALTADGAPGGSDAVFGREFGRYRLIGVIAQGGMGIVYRAEDGVLKRTVALKVLPLPYSTGTLRERFFREMRLAARLIHPHIVPVFDCGDAEGIPYFTMAFIEGAPLSAVLGECRRRAQANNASDGVGALYP